MKSPIAMNWRVTMSKNADMPAYPLLDAVPDGFEGLTKREHFAAMAMQGILASGIRNAACHF